jgi:hypothetical protein
LKAFTISTHSFGQILDDAGYRCWFGWGGTGLLALVNILMSIQYVKGESLRMGLKHAHAC